MAAEGEQNDAEEQTLLKTDSIEDSTEDTLLKTIREELLPLGVPLGLPLGVPLGLPLGVPLGLPLGVPLGLPLGLPGVNTGLHEVPQPKFSTEYDVRYSRTRPQLQETNPKKYVPQLYDDTKWENVANIPPGPNFHLLCKEEIKVSFPPNSPSCAPAFTTFDESGLHPGILENIQRRGFEQPTPIQRQAIPILLTGRDLIGCAPTGSGKTCAFVLPILHNLLCSDGKPRPTCPSLPYVLILEPTRELAQQIHYEISYFSKHLDIHSLLLLGEAYETFNRFQLQGSGVHVVVGTVGKVAEWIRKGFIKFQKLELLIIDEADRMLENENFMELRHEILIPLQPRKIIGENASSFQTAMFSATYPPEMQELSGHFLKEDYVFLSVGTVGAANLDVHQTILQVESQEEKRDLLFDVLTELHDKTNGHYKALIFVNRRCKADFLAVELESQPLIALSIHSGVTQRQREVAIDLFRQDGRVNILVASDLCSRGLDIKNLDIVINFDMPKNIQYYVHRIGRTGRVGRSGKAISFLHKDTDQHIIRPLVAVLRDAEQHVPEWLSDMSNRCPSDAAPAEQHIPEKLSDMSNRCPSDAAPLPLAHHSHQQDEQEDW
ncbi:unnamed protein product [Cyprideis torosa]|uniref:RNA helicase n=1 Tax=Cyprideis torosa TaxID=163714 RepID=A0A7R8WG40_9CRUS|nr:unnamed protein product [Cyprideis torosa]CAG0897736.1 unnamed protein product [Cyprideis torosa]